MGVVLMLSVIQDAAFMANFKPTAREIMRRSSFVYTSRRLRL